MCFCLPGGFFASIDGEDEQNRSASLDSNCQSGCTEASPPSDAKPGHLVSTSWWSKAARKEKERKKRCDRRRKKRTKKRKREKNFYSSFFSCLLSMRRAIFLVLCLFFETCLGFLRTWGRLVSLVLRSFRPHECLIFRGRQFILFVGIRTKSEDRQWKKEERVRRERTTKETSFKLQVNHELNKLSRRRDAVHVWMGVEYCAFLCTYTPVYTHVCVYIERDRERDYMHVRVYM